MEFIKSDKSYIPVELEIMNSHPKHNLLSDKKEVLTESDLLEEHDGEKELNKERYLVKVAENYIGIIDFIMKHPKDDKPWLGLFIIHQAWVGKGYTEEAFKWYVNVMKSRGVKEVRLGCFKENERGLHFWKKQKFYEVKVVDYKNKQMLVLEKDLQ